MTHSYYFSMIRLDSILKDGEVVDKLDLEDMNPRAIIQFILTYYKEDKYKHRRSLYTMILYLHNDKIRFIKFCKEFSLDWRFLWE